MDISQVIKEKREDNILAAREDGDKQFVLCSVDKNGVPVWKDRFYQKMEGKFVLRSEETLHHLYGWLDTVLCTIPYFKIYKVCYAGSWRVQANEDEEFFIRLDALVAKGGTDFRGKTDPSMPKKAW